MQISGVFLLLCSRTNARARQDLYDSSSTAFIHTQSHSQRKMKVPQSGFKNKIYSFTFLSFFNSTLCEVICQKKRLAYKVVCFVLQD